MQTIYFLDKPKIPTHPPLASIDLSPKDWVTSPVSHL